MFYSKFYGFVLDRFLYGDPRKHLLTRSMCIE